MPALFIEMIRRKKIMGDEFKSGGGPMNAAKDNAKIINNYFAAQKEFVPPSGQQKIFFGVPNLPPNHLPRPKYIEEFRAVLHKESIGLTGAAHVGVEGMGGIGKSVLAAALVHDEAVQAAFSDGIFWLTFGQNVEDDALLVQQNNILKLLGHQEQEISLDLSRHKLNSVLHGKRCLFIIDDIWDSRHLKHFDLSGTACRFLLTSRKADVLDRLGMERKRIDLLSEEQALVMLAQYARCILADLPKEAAEIVKECGYLPLAVAAIGSMVRGKPADRWQLALRKLQEAKLNKIFCKFDYQYENLFRALQVSVEALPEEQQQYYKTLAVFPEDANIQKSAIVMYWEYCAVSDDEPQDVIDALVDASLLTRVDDKTLRLHDLLRDYLISQTEDVVVLHKTLLDAYKAKYPGGWHKIPVEAYSYFHNYWYIHAKVIGDDALAAEIADDLIFCQPNIGSKDFRKSLEFVDYQIADIAPHLLREKRDPFVLRYCLDSLGTDGKQKAHYLLKERLSPYVEYACLEFLGEEGKPYAQRLIKESDNWLVLGSCLNLLKEEAKEDARRILTENKHPELTGICLRILGDEAKEDTRRLLRSSNDEDELVYLFPSIGKDNRNEAKVVAQRLLKTTKREFIKTMCQEHLNMWRRAELEDENQ